MRFLISVYISIRRRTSLCRRSWKKLGSRAASRHLENGLNVTVSLVENILWKKIAVQFTYAEGLLVPLYFGVGNEALWKSLCSGPRAQPGLWRRHSSVSRGRGFIRQIVNLHLIVCSPRNKLQTMPGL